MRTLDRWPTQPTKREGNSHAKDFVGDSVELDAIPPHVLPALVRDCIERHVDFHHLADLHARERREREWLLSMARAFDDGEGEP